jgi:hypothetical protein
MSDTLWVDESFAGVVEELKKREPAFHQAELCSTREALELYAAPDFWEVGASGQVYDREFVLDTVEKRFREQTEADTSQWETTEFACSKLGDDVYLVTYQLKQGSRLTRRASIWRKVRESWQIVYHQGTIVSTS